MDLFNQTVFLDAAAIPLDHDMLRDSQQHILKVQERAQVDLRIEYQGHFYQVWQALHVQLWNGCLSKRISK
ncbi:hypothetical protein K469DRAFT_705121 [Zopfia rhizophila CBS 207.26]|uniref:Uncharacterized protein n=1 Tax=Zopfia rhizophila CBS 207.26 TaxID=1314779 RepID=A0A6A6E9F2_9PEZI|nr:hypothetical protein K469DRAFT_705121 [Zopfia rhizophila CBS 207.26]